MVVTAKELFRPDLIQVSSYTQASDMLVYTAAISRDCLVS